MKDQAADLLSIVKLSDLIEILSSQELKELLTTFFCKKNDDVQKFLRVKVVDFEKANKSTTYLLCLVDQNKIEIVAYYSIASTIFIFEVISKSTKKKLVGHENLFRNEHPVILLGQVARNDLCSYKVESKTLFKSIFSTFKTAISLLGGFRFIYLECKNIPKLISIYESYGFSLLKDNKGLPIIKNELLTMVMSYDLLKEVKL